MKGEFGSITCQLASPGALWTAAFCAVCGVYCGMGRVFKDVCEREEACVQVMNVMVKVGVLSDTRRARCPKLNYQPGDVISANSRPP